MERYIKFIVVVIIIFSPILANAHPEDYKNFRKIDMNVYKDGKIIANAQQGVKVLERNFEDHIVRLKVRGAKPRIKQIINSVN